MYRIIRGVVSQCNGLWRVGGLDCQRVSFTLTSTQHIVVVLHMTSTTECVTILGREIQTKFDIEKTLFSSHSHPPTIEWQYYLSRESCWSPKILLISSFIFPISSGHEWEYSQDRIRSDRHTQWEERKEFQMGFASIQTSLGFTYKYVFCYVLDGHGLYENEGLLFQQSLFPLQNINIFELWGGFSCHCHFLFYYTHFMAVIRLLSCCTHYHHHIIMRSAVKILLDWSKWRKDGKN